jgi:hypothetical protein
LVRAETNETFAVHPAAYEPGTPDSTPDVTILRRPDPHKSAASRRTVLLMQAAADGGVVRLIKTSVVFACEILIQRQKPVRV